MMKNPGNKLPRRVKSRMNNGLKASRCSQANAATEEDGARAERRRRAAATHQLRPPAVTVPGDDATPFTLFNFCLILNASEIKPAQQGGHLEGGIVVIDILITIIDDKLFQKNLSRWRSN